MMPRNIFKLVSTLFLLAACSAGEALTPETPVAADSVLLNGRIYTVDADRSWAAAAAIKDGKFIAVGPDNEISAFIGDMTAVTDLEGRMVLPGLHDTHIHIPSGRTVFAKGYCVLPDSNAAVTANELYDLIRACRDRDPDATGWFIGGGWPGGAFPPDGAPDKAPLDALFPDRPVFLRADSGHVAWVNSAALELAGITRETPDPENGEIQRDPDTGAATGTLFESAQSLVAALLPVSTEADNDAALIRGLQHANSVGITSLFDASARPDDLAAYGRLSRAGQLPVHLRTAIWAGTISGTPKSVEEITAIADTYEVQGIATRAVKIMLDGVMEGATAAQIDNYVGHDHAGAMFIAPEVLTPYVVALDAAGIQVKMHGYGRLAVREGLNAFEAAREANGDTGLRHHIDHLAQIHPDDYLRFGALGVLAGFSPYWAMPNSYEVELAQPLLGQERWIDSYPIRSVAAGGATIITGSDWPVSNMNPFHGITTGVTRMDPVHPERPPLNEDETVSLADMIAAHTSGGAFAMHQEGETGSIEVGKSADFIILDRNLFDIPIKDVRQTKVLSTYFKGNLVYSR